MITLTLIHPQESLPPQSWTFEDQPIIRIGRATDNHIVLYSAVVSRHHVEVQRVNNGWDIVSLGANGTYINGEKILQFRASDGVIFRLARSGPQLQVVMKDKAIFTNNPDVS